MRENYERGLYEGEEYIKTESQCLEGKTGSTEPVPETAIERAARTLLNLRASWEWATREEHRLMVHTMLPKAGGDVGTKRIVWVKVRPDYEILFRLNEPPAV